MFPSATFVLYNYKEKVATVKVHLKSKVVDKRCKVIFEYRPVLILK